MCKESILINDIRFWTDRPNLKVEIQSGDFGFEVKIRGGEL